MQHPDEGLIHTWLDGELGADEAASLEAHIADCAECSAKIAEARGLVAASSRIVSALDMVPSGVIPAASPRRAWYTGTQFRAAAAVMIVAGASFLVLQNRDKPTMERVMGVSRESAPSVTAPTPASAPAPAPASEASSDAVNPAPISPKRNTRPSQPERRAPAPAPASPKANEEAALSGKVSGIRVDASANRAVQDSPQRVLSLPTENPAVAGVTGGVARGVEKGFAPAELRKIRSDTTQSVTRTVFEVSSGVNVTLVDVTVPVVSEQLMQRKARAAAAPPAVARPEADAAKERIDTNTISWTDKRGHSMTLTGPLPKEQLELLRKRLPEEQR